MKIAIVGTGYVGLVSGACLADLGHTVACVDTDARKIEMLRQGKMPIFETGLEELVKRNAEAGRLSFTTDMAEALAGVEVASIAVGTPSAADGGVDMSYVEAAARDIGRYATGPLVVATKSTVPVGTAARLAETIRGASIQTIEVVSNPEFLREGSAVGDFMRPPRIIIGSSSPAATEVMLRLYHHVDCPKLVMDPPSAELSKYAANTFLAMRLSFMNELSHVCEAVGADVEQVARGVGSDPRIGKEFLRAGPGWGGSCFPKDVKALQKLGEKIAHPLPLVNATLAMNRLARQRVIERLTKELDPFNGRMIGVLGVAFKNNTDDTRESPAVDMIKMLLAQGARVQVHDPVARIVPEIHGFEVAHHADPYAVAQGAHAVLIATEWDAFRQLDLKRLRAAMAGDLLFDARNLIEPAQAIAHGFKYLRIGRSLV